jgi:hypothetical protein
VTTGIFYMGAGHKQICIQGFTSHVVAMAVMKKYLADHPEYGDAPASLVALAAFMKAWPCADRK